MSSKTKTTRDQTLAPFLQSQMEDQIGFARQIANTPFTPFTGPRVAGLTQDELLAAQQIRDINTQGIGRADFAAASDLLRQAGGYSPAQFQQNVAGFMSPYQSQVIDATLATMGRRQAEADAATRAQMAAGGAFGNQRRGVYEAQLAGERELQERQQLANLYNMGYDRASQLAAALPGQQLAAAGALAQLGQGRLGYETGLAGLLSRVGAQERQLSQAELDAQFAEFMREQQDPYQRQAALNAALTGLPGFAGTITETSKTGGLGGVLGAIGSLGGLASVAFPALGILGGAAGAAGAAGGGVGNIVSPSGIGSLF